MEVSLQIPNDIAELLKGTGKAIYVEAVKKVAADRLNTIEKRISELSNEIAGFEKKHNSTIDEFKINLPDTFEAHNDWQEWEYLETVRNQYRKKYSNLKLILQK